MSNQRTKYRLYFSQLSLLLWLVTAVLFASGAAEAQVASTQPVELEEIGIDEHLGDRIDLSLEFTDESGRVVTLGEYFRKDKPVVLSMVYFTCPMLCNLTMNGINEVVGELAWLPGEEYEIVMVSIHPDETPELALAKKNNYMSELNRPGAEDGWHFLTGVEANSKALAASIGFRYFWNEEQNQYAHASAIYVLTDEGELSRYLYGIQFPERDLRLSLLEASAGKIGSSFDQLILYCFHYDPDAKGYVVVAGNVMRLGGAVTLLSLILLITTLTLRERRIRRRLALVQTHSHEKKIG